MLKERHSTAKKLRKYYLQCLKQLLEEDRVALEGNTAPSSTEEKLNRMAVALRTLSPNKEAVGEYSLLVFFLLLLLSFSNITLKNILGDSLSSIFIL